jgi:hypothetical protein
MTIVERLEAANHNGEVIMFALAHRSLIAPFD